VAQVGPVRHAALRRGPNPHVPCREPGVPGLVRPGARAGPHRQVAYGAGRRGARLVARRRVPDRGAVLDGARDRTCGAAGRRGVRRAVDTVRGGHAEAAAPAAQLAAGDGRPGGGAELLAVARVAEVLAGVRRPVGGVRRQPVAAPGRARPRLGRRGLADQLRARAGERGHRHRAGIPATDADRHGRPARGLVAVGFRGPGRGRRAGQHRRRTAYVRAHPGQPSRPARHDRHGAAGCGPRRQPQLARVAGADRRPEPRRHAGRRPAGPDRLGREQHRRGPHAAGLARPAEPDRGAVG